MVLWGGAFSHECGTPVITDWSRVKSQIGQGCTDEAFTIETMLAQYAVPFCQVTPLRGLFEIQDANRLRTLRYRGTSLTRYTNPRRTTIGP